MTSPAQDTVDRLKPYVKELLGTEARDTAVQAASTATAAATSAEAAKQRSEEIATSTSWDGDRLTVNGQTSPSLTGDVSLAQLGAVAGWAADAQGGRNHFSYTRLSDLKNWNSGVYYVLKEVIQLEPNTEYTFYAEEVTADTGGEWTVLNLMDGTDGILPYNVSNTNRIRIIYNRKYEAEPLYGLSVQFTAPSSGKVYLEYYANAKFGSDTEPFWITEKLVRAQIVRGREAPEWRPSPEDAIRGYRPNGEPQVPTTPLDPATAIRVDNSVGTRVFVGDTMIHGDTGWRNVSTLLTYGWAGTARIRRVGNTTYLSINALPGSDRSALPIPAGFRGRTDHTVPVPMIIGNTLTGYARITTGAFVIADTATSATTARDIYVVYHTPDPWPTALPGTPA